MKRNLEITFMDGTKALHLAETWDDLIFRDNGILRIEYQGEAFAWYPIQNIKSIIEMLAEEDME